MLTGPVRDGPATRGSRAKATRNQECPSGAPRLAKPRTFENGVDVHWEGPHDRYGVEIARGDGTEAFEALGTGIERRLTPGRYSVRVRGIACQTLPGRWSNTEEFTIGSASHPPMPTG